MSHLKAGLCLWQSVGIKLASCYMHLLPHSSKVMSLIFKIWHYFWNWMRSEFKIKNWKRTILIRRLQTTTIKKQSGVGGFKFVLQLIYESPLTCKVKWSAKMTSSKDACIHVFIILQSIGVIFLCSGSVLWQINEKQCRQRQQRVLRRSFRGKLTN